MEHIVGYYLLEVGVCQVLWRLWNWRSEGTVKSDTNVHWGTNDLSF